MQQVSLGPCWSPGRPGGFFWLEMLVVRAPGTSTAGFVGFAAGIPPPPQPPFPVALTDPLGHPPAVLPPPPALSPIGVGIEAIGFRFLVCPTNSVNEP